MKKDREPLHIYNMINYLLDNFPNELSYLIISDIQVQKTVIKLLNRLKELETALNRLGIKLWQKNLL